MNIFTGLKLLAIAASVSLLTLAPLQTVAAAPSNVAPEAKVSFTFDDGLASALNQAAPTLANYGLKGVDYITTGCVGSSGTCAADETAQYMNWDQVLTLQNTYGWEIGAHTVSHTPLTTLGKNKKIQELANSKATLAAHGINATNFASPEGDYDPATLALIAQYYASHRGFKDQGNNVWPYNEYLMNTMPVQAGVSVDQVKSKIDQAIAGNYWLILTFHDIQPTPNSDPEEYEYATSDLSQIAAYVKSKQTAGLIKSTTIKDGFVTSDSNLLANGSFNNGIADGWRTDTPARVIQDTNTNGSYPDPTNSVRFTANNKNIHLFSPLVSVDPNATYAIKGFLNVTKATTGEIGYYVDEYDAAGNWISGQWKKAESSVFVENMNFSYKPTSSAVKKASLQIYVTANSGITAFVDNLQMFPLTATAPPAAPVNLVANGGFDNGIADGWKTDSPSTMAKDSGNNGSPANPLNSIKMISAGANTHLFSPLVNVDSTKSYSLATYLKLAQRSSGEVGYYIDEYDVNGNWVSGQWKTGVSTVLTGDISFQYKPSSANVKKASLQIIVVGSSNIVAYIDHARWYQN